ncbi:leucine rich repeat containing protein BspA family protein, partial [Entamoeba invadens IP1]
KVVQIGESCFSGCIKLSKVELPESLTTMGKTCFTQCDNLMEIELPKKLVIVTSLCFPTYTKVFRK